MKTIKITYEAVFNIGNYQTLRLGGEYTLEPKETEKDAYVAIDRQLREAAAAIVEDRKQAMAESQAKAEQAKAEQDVRVTIKDTDTKQINKIGEALAKRVQDGMSVEEVMANVDKYYNVSDKVRKLWHEAVKLAANI